MRYRELALCLSLLILPLAGWAAPKCSVATSGMHFGTSRPNSAVPVDSIAKVQLSCDAGLAYVLESSTAQLNADGSRELRSGTAATDAAYFLHIDAARTRVWGDGTGNTYVIRGVSTGAPEDIPIYGRVPALQPLGAGTYKDKVLVRVEF